ncbi:MAG: MoaD/ThiS family protein, partial [Actinomycetota bacterium]
MAHLRLFAILRELAGTSHSPTEGATVGEVLEAAGRRFGPEFARAAGASTIAVNGVDARHLAGLNTQVGPEDEVALLPPVSGGSTTAQERPARWPLQILGAEAAFWLGLIAASWLHPWALTALAG